jgi:cell shape-determining protein MreC
MHRRKPGTRSTKTYLVGLLTVSLIALLLPHEWTGKLISIVQIIVPFQHAATSAADAVVDVVRPGPRAVPGEEAAVLERQKIALEHQVAAMATRVAELEREVEVLTAMRLWNAGGRQLGALGKLVPAKVITEDLLAWRSSRLINAGSLQGVQRGAAITSRAFTIDQGNAAGVRGGLPVLLREVLVGIVDQVGTHTSRVRLLDDPKTAMKVRVGRLSDGGFAPLGRYFWLTGHGGGTMEIRDAERREVEAGLIQVGDMVLSDPMDDILPSAMTIGRIERIESDHKNPLLSIVTVNSELDEHSLRRVYVYVPEAPPDTALPGGG